MHYEYLVEHARKNVLQDTLNQLAIDSWKLHSVFEQPSGYVLVMERIAPSALIIPDDVDLPSPSGKVKKTKTVEFVKTGNEE